MRPLTGWGMCLRMLRLGLAALLALSTPSAPGTALAVFILFSATVSHGDEGTTLTPPGTTTFDSELREGAPNTNFGTNATMTVRSRTGNLNRRAVIEFDLTTAGIPTTAAVKVSYLRLFMSDAPTFNRTHAAHFITGTTSWTGTTVTWNDRTTGTPWTTPGGDFNAMPAATITTGTTDNVQHTWTILGDGTVANIPQLWLTAPASNQGLIVKDTAESGSASATDLLAQYVSQNAANPAEYPMLELRYLRDVTLGAAVAGVSEITWSWTFPAGSTAANYDGVLFAKKQGAAAPTFVPADGTSYAVGDQPVAGESVAVNTTSFVTLTAVDENGPDTIVLPGTQYTYKAYTHDDTTITGAASAAPPHYAFGVAGSVTTSAGGGLNKNWSYRTGATTLAPPALLPGDTIVTGSNDNKVHSMNFSTGERRYRPVAPVGTTGGAIQSRPPIIPAAFSSAGADVVYVGAGDGKVYAFNILTGVKLWESAVLTLGGGSIQGGAAVQIKAVSSAGFTHLFDQVVVGTRNVGAGSDTNNQVVALNGNTGATVWTFAPGNLDIINSTPQLDYANNTVWVTSRAGLAGTQPSLWKLNSVTGALIESFNLTAIDGSPTLNGDGKVIYAVTNVGRLVATRTDITACTLETNPGTGAGVGFPIPISAGANSDDIFFSTTNTVNKVRFDYSASACSGNFTTPATGWTNPVIASPSTPIFSPPPLAFFLYVGAADGRLYKIDPNTGALLDSRTVNLGAIIGDPSFDVVSLKLYVGDSSGRIYSFDQF